MFDKRIEPRYNTKMRNSDIETAREIAADMKKLAETARDMHNSNARNLYSSNPIFLRAARNILRVYSLIQDAYWELESLHEAYTAQFTDFDDDGEIIDNTPDFDYSEQSLLEAHAVKMWNNARNLMIRSILTFADKTGFNSDYWELLTSDEALNTAIREYITPVIVNYCRIRLFHTKLIEYYNISKVVDQQTIHAFATGQFDDPLCEEAGKTYLRMKALEDELVDMYPLINIKHWAFHKNPDRYLIRRMFYFHLDALIKATA